MAPISFSPISFSKNKHAGSRSGAMMKAQNGKWHVITGWLKAEATVPPSV
jgi:hypothetical protein